MGGFGQVFLKPVAAPVDTDKLFESLGLGRSDAHPGRPGVSVPTRHSAVRSLAVLPDGSIAAGSDDGQLQVYRPGAFMTLDQALRVSGEWPLG